MYRATSEDSAIDVTSESHLSLEMEIVDAIKHVHEHFLTPGADIRVTKLTRPLPCHSVDWELKYTLKGGITKEQLTVTNLNAY